MLTTAVRETSRCSEGFQNPTKNVPPEAFASGGMFYCHGIFCARMRYTFRTK